MLSTPQSRDWKGVPGDDFNAANLCRDIALLPTPAVNDMGAAYTPETWDAWTAEMKAKHNNGNGHGKSLNVEAQRLLPTPTRRDHKDSEIRREPHRPDDVDTLARAMTVLLPTPTASDSKASGSAGYTTGNDGVTLTDAMVRGAGLMGRPQDDAQWGEYEPAIRRWESVTRPAPEPTKLNSKGTPKLSDDFDEWLMGYPEGWITDVPGVTWNQTLKACGNGVVPQQGAAAVRFLLEMGRATA